MDFSCREWRILIYSTVHIFAKSFAPCLRGPGGVFKSTTIEVIKF
jgi:hypothetical protein